MNRESLELYDDDEGISVNLTLDAFDEKLIQVVYLESEFGDDKFFDDIAFILNNQDEFFELAKKEISLYANKSCGSKEIAFKLMKIYIFPDIENEFGFVFRWHGDTEHGIGIKFLGLSVKKIGSAEIAFL